MQVFGTIDVSSMMFWSCVGAAILFQPLQVNELARRVTLAAVNLWFLYYLLGASISVPIAFLLGCWVVSHAFAHGPTIRLAARMFAVIVLTVLFLDGRIWFDGERKIPELAVIGYGYIFCRAIDMLRVCWETKQPASLLSCVNYLMPFHMLAAGPIAAWQDFQDNDHRTSIDAEAVLGAAERIARGMFKKYVIAYSINEVFLTSFQT